MNYPHMKLSAPSTLPMVKINCDPIKEALTRFINAVVENPDKGWAFVSRVYSAGLNLEELQNIFKLQPASICGAKYVTRSKNAIIHSMVIGDKNSHTRHVMHLHMVKQPDKNSQWKIFGVEFTQWK